MIDAAVAETLGVDRADADNLLNGFASAGIADAVGISQLHIQPFLDNGIVVPVLADRLGIPAEAVEELSMRLTKKGRVGLLIGMLMPR